MSVFVLFIGIFSGFFSGLLGLGGGLIMTPMFLHGPSTVGVGALTVKEITGLTMVQGFAGAVSGLARHRGYGMVSWRLVRYAGFAAGLSALAGAVISKWVADGAILAIFGAMALIASALIFLPGSRTAQDESDPGPFSFNAPLAVILGGAIGFAIASNLGIILFSAVGGIAGKLTTAQVPIELALIMVAGSVPSAQVGAIVSRRMQPRLLRYALALVVGGAAVRIWFDVLS